MFKKTISALVIFVVSSAVSLSPRTSEAIVAYQVSNKVVTIVAGGAGGAATGLGAVMTYGGVSAFMTLTHSAAAAGGAILAIVTTAVGGAFLVAGVILLDADEQIDFRYQQISTDEALSLNLSEEEAAKYNANVEVFNAVKDEIMAQVPEDVTVEEANRFWVEYTNSLAIPAPALEALNAVNFRLLQAMSDQH